jgi:hypothetical protein
LPNPDVPPSRIAPDGVRSNMSGQLSKQRLALRGSCHVQVDDAADIAEGLFDEVLDVLLTLP